MLKKMWLVLGIVCLSLVPHTVFAVMQLNTGFASFETWTNLSSDSDLGTVPFDTQPDSTGLIRQFETTTNAGDRYGMRVRAYVIAPQTGNYVFWIAGDDVTSLRLSTDSDSANAQPIAGSSKWTSSRQWDKYSSQQSQPIHLEEGNIYFIEAQLKETSGGDNLAVGWQLPDGTMERPVPGNRLIPFDASLLEDIAGEVYAEGYWCASSAASHSLWLPDIDKNLHFDDSGRFIENGDGTATLTGRVVSASDPNRGFDVQVNISGYIAPWEPTPSGSPKELKDKYRIENGGPVDPDTWRYYTNFEGILTGFGDWEGGVLSLVRRGPAFQVGLGGNAKNTSYGGASWISYTIVSQPTNNSSAFQGNRGDFNVSFTDCEKLKSTERERSCHSLYALHDGNLNDSQFFTVDTKNNYAIAALGTEKPGHDIESLVIDPNTGKMYASSGDDPEGYPIGHLYEVDKGTGEITAIGSTGLGEISALSFRPSTGELWAWGDRQGIFVISPKTGAVIREVLSVPDGEIEDMTWLVDPDTNKEMLYGSAQRELWSYDPDTGTTEMVCPIPDHPHTALPNQTEALEGMPDGSLLFAVHKSEDLKVYSLNPKTCEVLSSITFETPYYDIEGIAWDCR